MLPFVKKRKPITKYGFQVLLIIRYFENKITLIYKVGGFKIFIFYLLFLSMGDSNLGVKNGTVCLS